ncbi:MULTISPECIES: GreA/GreB family elongation factor [Mesonia]|uniref:Transcription elongation factor GreA n=1 Tax=Mesonia oceanica TaxID=2687242 RepID=A0AC61YDZ0_9FLAO|nr:MULTISPECIES: GreA/GreB family elongation factor [Mesonia]MAN26459.1 transcription elongation factor GreA [Mesonia sp.]MAQ41561.1 transcription elongation factor GreA [Mesonia sp.]VVV02258.1 Transcription elongation factor GreA [Mesonia oceanica]|tara:strand:- start:4464 stop:4958 length:495 start_codon:yes stop_codon:yes gene_type:complete
MSRGFVKEEDQEEAPIIPPRAALPAGVTNYVTPNGYEALQQELKDLEGERSSLDTKNETEKRRAAGIIDGKINLLKERISTARIIYLNEQPKDEIRFGAKVELMINGKPQKFQIVGVDEADIKKQKIAFVAPLAKKITGKKEGEEFDFRLGEENRKIKIKAIDY